MNLFLPSCSPHAPSDARLFFFFFLQCPLLHGLTETQPLPIIPMDTVIDMGSGAGQRAGECGSLPSSRADVMDTLLARLPPLTDVVF